MDGNRSRSWWFVVRCFLKQSALVGWLLMGLTSAAEKQVKVFLLVGQSNMEGKGNPAHLDTYRDDPLIQPTYSQLKNGDGWKPREDVWITYPTKSGGAKHGLLTVGYGTKGKDSIGPEFGFGHAVGNLVDGPVLLIKIAWGGKSVAVDFRPPSCPPREVEVKELWERQKKKMPTVTLQDTRERFGFYYREMIRIAQQEFASFQGKFPELAGCHLELAGLIWHQGFNDKVNHALRDERYASYTRWMIQFIQDVRNDLDAPQLPVVIGELGVGGIPARGDFQVAQANIARYEGFAGTVAFVPTAQYYDTWAEALFEKQYWKGTEAEKAEWQKVGNDRPYHYLGSGKTYYLKGVAFAEQVMVMQEQGFESPGEQW